MKKLLLVLLFATFTLVLGIGNAKALVMDSVPILMIDGDNDGNDTTVTILITDGVNAGFDFGYVDETNAFTELITNGNYMAIHPWEGGDIVDFAIRDVRIGAGTYGYIYSLGKDESGNNYATLNFDDENKILASSSENPHVSYDYWRAVNIDWSTPTHPIPGVNPNAMNVVMELNAGNDGVAPAVPEPSSMMLLGMGVLGLLGFRRKKS